VPSRGAPHATATDARTTRRVASPNCSEHGDNPIGGGMQSMRAAAVRVVLVDDVVLDVVVVLTGWKRNRLYTD
jgi:hypothetical protein